MYADNERRCMLIQTVCEKNMCAGCNACVNVCSHNAIKIVDLLYAYNAVIDEDLCVDCNACRQLCQYNKDVNATFPLSWNQGWAKSEEIRKNSSSGGAATALAIAFIKKGGLVCSCTLREGEFKFEFANSLDDLKKFSGSKYVKSNPEGIYRIIREKLKEGEKVLFIGLPCQVAALKLFIGEKYENGLYTVDLICHGTPSPKLLEMYLSENRFSLNNIRDIKFRKKTVFHLFNEYEEIGKKKTVDNYTFSFLSCLDYTENCYSCKYAKSERVSDITIGDSWGSELDSEEKKKGISLVLCQSKKGEKLLENSEMNLLSVDLDNAIKNNKQLQYPSKKPEKRDKFFTYILDKNGFDKAVMKSYRMVFFKRRIRMIVKTILTKAKILQGGEE